MKKLLCVFLLILLSGCNEQQTSYYYFSHPLRLKHVALSCNKLSAADFRDSKRCQMIFKQVSLLQGYSREFVRNQQLFGQNILALQMQLADLKQQSVKGDASKTAQEIDSLQYQIKRRLFVVSSFVMPGLQ